MATRMQQRRGFQAQWTAANPVLAAGEIGFETDTNKFKMGNGTSTWSELVYFANATELAAAIDSVVGMSPESLDTLAEIAASLGGDSNFLSALATNQRVDGIVLQGAANLTQATTASTTALNTHSNNTISVHGIADTSLLATTANVATAKSEAIFAANSATEEIVSNTVAALTKSSVGLANVDNTSDADKPVSTAQALAIQTAQTNAVEEALGETDNKIADHVSVATGIHGITNTADLAYLSDVDNAVSAHNLVTTDVHGIADTSQLALLSDVAAVTPGTIGLASVDNTADADKPVSTAQALAIQTAKTEAITNAATAADTKVSDHNLETQNVHGISNTAELVTQDDLTNAINGVTADQSSLAGLGIDWNSANLQFDIDDTVATKTYADGAVSTHNSDTTSVHGIADTAELATKTYVNNAATAAVEAVVAAAPAAFDTLKEIADYIASDQTASSAVTSSIALKAPINSPTFTGTVTVAAQGIAFTDGTQVKAGVPSITTFATEVTSSATLAAGEADKFVPLNGAVTITLPASGYSTGQSIDFWQSTGTGAQFASTNGVVGTPGYKFRTTNSVVTAMKTPSGWLIFGDLSQ